MTFAAAGARVVVNYRQDEAGAADVVTDICALGSDAIAVQADISREADVQRLFASSIAQFGAPDIVVNNAGMFHHGDFASLSVSDMQQQLNVNLLGTLLVCQQAAQHFARRLYHQPQRAKQPAQPARLGTVVSDQRRNRYLNAGAGT